MGQVFGDAVLDQVVIAGRDKCAEPPGRLRSEGGQIGEGALHGGDAVEAACCGSDPVEAFGACLRILEIK